MRIRLGFITVMAVISLAGSAAAQRPPLPSPGVPPEGANDPACRSERPPVLLIHGTRADMTVNFQGLSPHLRDAGWCVWALDLPDRGQAPLAESVAALADFAAAVRRTTGSKDLSFAGHSLGGLVARRHAKDVKGRGIDDVVSFGTPQYGYFSPPPDDQVDALFNTECPSCWEMAQGSPFITELNEGDPTPGRVSWTQIVTVQDAVAKPYQNQYLPEERLVANVTLDELCPGRPFDHLLLAYDPVVFQVIEGALARTGPADPQAPVTC